MKRISSFIPATVWAITILWLSLLPGNDLPKWWFFERVFIDKWVHITLYLIFSVLLAIAFRYKKSFSSSSIQWAVAGIAIAYGILMEILQETLTTTRHFEWADITADTLGAILGVLAVRYALKKKMFFTKP